VEFQPNPKRPHPSARAGSKKIQHLYRPIFDPNAPQQIELAASGRNILQYFQIGPAARPYSDYSYRKLSAAFAGIV
jgi:hypothetical protein